MVNEEILTSLKNAVESGESLKDAIALAINSGYNPKDVQEAAQFVGGGVMNSFQPMPNEQLTMPSQKNTLQSSQSQQIKESNFQSMQSTKNYVQQNNQAIKQNISDGSVLSSYSSQQNPYYSPDQSPSTSQSQSDPYFLPQSNPDTLSNQLVTMSPPKQGYTKEIALLVVLLVLIGILIGTIVFREKILTFLSSFS